MASVTLPDVPGLSRSYSGHFHGMDVTAAKGENGWWGVGFTVPGAWDDSGDHEAIVSGEDEALYLIREFVDFGRIPDLARPVGAARGNAIASRLEAFRRIAEVAAETQGCVADRIMDYEEWLEEFGRSPDFIGSPSEGIPGSVDLWEASNRIAERRGTDPRPALR